MKETFLTLLLIIFGNLYSQSTKSFESGKGFKLVYEIQILDSEKSKVMLTIENIDNQTKYISIYERNLDIRSNKLAIYDLSYILITDPLLSPEMYFDFIKLDKGSIYKTERILYTKDVEKINFRFEYFVGENQNLKKLKLIDSEKSIYALKCKDYVDFAYKKDNMLYFSENLNL
jgi:hypothetical protein